MKPTKRTAAKVKRPAKRKPAIKRNSVDEIIRNVNYKLLRLRARIDITQTSEKKHIDLKWVDMHIRDTEAGIVFGKNYMLKANDMWSKYA